MYIYSMIVAIVGSIVVLLIYNALMVAAVLDAQSKPTTRVSKRRHSYAEQCRDDPA